MPRSPTARSRPTAPPLPPEILPTPAAPAADPRTDALINTLIRQTGGGGGAQDTLGSSIQSALLPLLQGKGVQVGDVKGDPEARAFRLARTRELEGSQAGEAERLAASGLSGSGASE